MNRNESHLFAPTLFQSCGFTIARLDSKSKNRARGLTPLQICDYADQAEQWADHNNLTALEWNDGYMGNHPP